MNARGIGVSRWILAAVVATAMAAAPASAEPPVPEATDEAAPPPDDAPPADDARAAAMLDDVPEATGPMPLPEGLPDEARFVRVKLHGEVSLGMAAFIERVTDNLRKGDILVLEVNTFGGRVDAAVAIKDALLSVRERKQAWTVAYINPRAISAGALISYGTDVIVLAPAATMGAATPVQIDDKGEMKSVGKKVVSYMVGEMKTTARARGRNEWIAAAMVDAQIAIPGLDTADEVLTLTNETALKWGVASFEAKSFDELVAGLGYGGDGKPYTTAEVSWSWAEKLAGWLTSATISGLLMTLGMLGIMIGLYTGGSPLALGLGGTCLGLFFFGHTIVNLAGIEDILLFAVGVGLIAVEVFLPGHIVPGIVGILCVLAALILGLIDFDNVDFAVQWEAGYISRALTVVFGSILATAVLTYAAFKVLPESRFGRGLMLSATVAARATDNVEPGQTSLIGKMGEAVTDLRPAGKVLVDGRRVEAKAERGYIDKGATVEVIKRDGFSLVVAERKEIA